MLWVHHIETMGTVFVRSTGRYQYIWYQVLPVTWYCTGTGTGHSHCARTSDSYRPSPSYVEQKHDSNTNVPPYVPENPLCRHEKSTTTIHHSPHSSLKPCLSNEHIPCVRPWLSVENPKIRHLDHAVDHYSCPFSTSWISRPCYTAIEAMLLPFGVFSLL